MSAIEPNYPQAEDTPPEADYRFSLLQRLTPQQRLEIASVHNRGVRKLTLIGTKLRHQHPEHIKAEFTRAVLGQKFSPMFCVTGDELMWTQDSIALAQQLHLLLDRLLIPYYVTGGVATSVHGEPRSTQDLNLAIQALPSDVTRLCAVLEREGYYCPPGAIADIQSGRGILSVTHMETINNADIVVSASTPFDESKMSRRLLLDENFWIVSPEDLILAKLLWGKGQSEKQWRDVLGVLKIQGKRLDLDYLERWAVILELETLLSRAVREAGM